MTVILKSMALKSVFTRHTRPRAQDKKPLSLMCLRWDSQRGSSLSLGAVIEATQGLAAWEAL